MKSGWVVFNTRIDMTDQSCQILVFWLSLRYTQPRASIKAVSRSWILGNDEIDVWSFGDVRKRSSNNLCCLTIVVASWKWLESILESIESGLWWMFFCINLTFLIFWVCFRCSDCVWKTYVFVYYAPGVELLWNSCFVLFMKSFQLFESFNLLKMLFWTPIYDCAIVLTLKNKFFQGWEFVKWCFIVVVIFKISFENERLHWMRRHRKL